MSVFSSAAQSSLFCLRGPAKLSSIPLRWVSVALAPPPLSTHILSTVALAAALDATLVGAGPARRVPAAAVLEQAGVPLQTQAVAARAGLPRVTGRAAGGQGRGLRPLGQQLKHRGLHT